MILGGDWPFEPDERGRHWLHGPDRSWAETNCYADLWIEVLHAAGLDPVASLAGAAAMGFPDDHWGFFKPSTHDLRTLYGIVVDELAVWRGIDTHIDTQLTAGRLLTVEVDGYFLPDTAGVTYRNAHAKTTIVPFEHDAAARRLRYIHNATVAEVVGDDHDGLLDVAGLVPYVEVVRFDRAVMLPDDELRHSAAALAAEHLAHAPPGNPVEAMREQFEHELDRLTDDLAAFHTYAFVTLRLCGAQASLAQAFQAWLGSTADALVAAEAWGELADAAKTAQFRVARRAAGRTSSLDDVLTAMAIAWERATEASIDAVSVHA